MRITALAIAAVVLGISAPASAADLYSAPLSSAAAGNGVKCTVVNKGPTGNITVTVRIHNNLTGDVCIVGPVTLAPEEGTFCISPLDDKSSFCKVTTSSTARTKAVFMTLDSADNATAMDIPR